MEFCGEWTAIHDRMPGGDPTLRVEGTCCFPTSGWKAEIREHDGPQGINPRIRMLDLAIEASDNPVVNPVLTEVPVRWEETTAASYDQVHILVVGGDGVGESSKVIDVQEVS